MLFDAQMLFPKEHFKSNVEKYLQTTKNQILGSV